MQVIFLDWVSNHYSWWNFEFFSLDKNESPEIGLLTLNSGLDAPENQYWQQNGIQNFLKKTDVIVEKLVIFDKIGNVRPKFLGNSENINTLKSIEKRLVDLKYLETGMFFQYDDEVFARQELRLVDVNCKVFQILVV